MITADGFKIAKRKARLELLDETNQQFNYLSDSANQWEWSYSSKKYQELIGSQSISYENLHEVKEYLGELNAQENYFYECFFSFYQNLSKLFTTTENSFSTDCDIYETLLDNRILCEFPIVPRKILDIGPGASRQLANLFLTGKLKDSIYVAIESIGICYGFQNMASSYMSTLDSTITFTDLLDFDLSRKEFPDIELADKNSIFQMPLWFDQKLPDSYFDIIYCDYLLDEVSSEDFHRIMGILRRCLSPDGIVYCRGSQHRAMINGIHPFGGGTFHGQDITVNFNNNEMQVLSSRLVASQLTRIFSRNSSSKYIQRNDAYINYKDDVSLNSAIQSDLIMNHMKYIAENNLSCVIWGKPLYQDYKNYIEAFIGDIKLLGFTHQFAYRDRAGPPEGQNQLLMEDMENILPDVVIVACQNVTGIIRELREVCGSDSYKTVYHHNIPIAFVYNKIPNLS